MSCCTDNIVLDKRDEKRRIDFKHCTVCGKEYFVFWAKDWLPPTKKRNPNLEEINGRFVDRPHGGCGGCNK